MHTSNSLDVAARISAFAAQYSRPEWYVALVAAHFRRNGDIQQALHFADQAIRSFPTPDSVKPPQG
jgi:hypothetical protein